MTPLRIGVLGCADIALRRVLPALAAAPEWETVAVASRDPEKAKRTAQRFGCRPVRGYQALLDLDELDAVYVPLPAALHARWVEAALRAGKHVLAEKPVTTDPLRTERLFALAASVKRVLMENVMFVHHPQHAAVRRLLGEGAIGELRALHAAFAIPPPPDGDIRYRAELDGGALWDVGLYPVRAAVYFLGCALEVAGAVLRRGPGHQVDTSGAALLTSPQGATAQLTFGMEHVYTCAYQLWGSEGRITVERAFTTPADLPPQVRLETRSGVRELRLPPDDQVARTLAAFAQAVRSGSAPAGEVLAQARLLREIRRRSALT